MKRLISLVSTQGKPQGQAAKEAWEAFQKYQKVSEKVVKDILSKNKLHRS